MAMSLWLAVLPSVCGLLVGSPLTRPAVQCARTVRMQESGAFTKKDDLLLEEEIERRHANWQQLSKTHGAFFPACGG